MLLPLLASLTALVGAPLLHRRLRQRQHARRLVHTGPHAIAESRFVRLGGVDQWVGVRGEDRRNPLLLVLHGGPGYPYSLFTPILRPWERHFTIVQWDRRGVGKTLGRTGKAGTGELGFPRMVDDAIELSEHLHHHFPHTPQIALGGSMGNLVGVPLVKRRPDLFAAYVATDLGIDVAACEQLTWQHTLDRLRAAGDRRGVATLTAIGPDPARWTYAQWQAKQKLILKTDPRMRDVGRQLLLPLILAAPEHGLRDVLHVLQGLEFAAERLFPAYMAHAARDLGPRFELPFFLLQGDDDVFTPTRLATDYFATIDAPHKQLALIPEAGHFAAFTRPEHFLDELRTRVLPLVAPPR